MSRFYRSLQRLSISAVFIILLCSTVFSFQPVPQPGFPIITVEGDSDLRFTYLYSFIELGKDTATVDLALIIELSGSTRDSLLLKAYLRKDSLSIEVNGKTYLFNSKRRSYRLPRGGKSLLYLFTRYKISTHHTFSGPPGPWVKGKVFNVTTPLKTSQGRRSPIRSNILVQAPSQYRLKGERDAWKKKFSSCESFLYKLIDSSSLEDGETFLHKYEKGVRPNGK